MKYSYAIQTVSCAALVIGALALAEMTMSQTAGVDASATNVSFDEKVRSTLLRNPHVLVEVFELLENEQKTLAVLEDQRLINQKASILFDGVKQEDPVIVEFFDYNCAYCRQAHIELKAIRSANSELPIVQFHLPILGQNSLLLSKKMIAVREIYGTDAYQELHTRIMEDDGRLKARFDEELVSLGYDLANISGIAGGEEVAREIRLAQTLARDLGISGTPAFVTREKIFRGFVRRTELINAAFIEQ